jgi:hypothetical protein
MYNTICRNTLTIFSDKKGSAMLEVSKEKKELIKKIRKLNEGKKNLNSKLLNIVKDEIKELLSKGLSIVDVFHLIKEELNLSENYTYDSFRAWVQRNIKKNKGGQNAVKQQVKEKNDDNTDDDTDTNLDKFFEKTQKFLK